MLPKHLTYSPYVMVVSQLTINHNTALKCFIALHSYRLSYCMDTEVIEYKYSLLTRKKKKDINVVKMLVIASDINSNKQHEKELKIII